MAYSTQSVVSDGSLVLLDISIEYFDRSEIGVYFNSAPTTAWAWVGVSDTQITFAPAVPVGTTVLIVRKTDLSNLRHEFSLGAAFTAQYLDEDLRQVLHIAQEALEGNFGGDFYGDIDMHTYRVRGSGDPLLPQDLTTKHYVDTFFLADKLAAVASAASAATSATNAAASQLAAAASASAADLSETNAAASEVAAAASAATATTQAGTATTQAGIATTQAGIATTQAGIATTQASNASTSASNAANSASAAATSATNAATSETNAQSWAAILDPTYVPYTNQQNNWTKPQAPTVGTLTYASTVNWDCLANGQSVALVATGNFTLAAPTNVTHGCFYVLRLSPSALSNVTWNAAYKFPNGLKPVFTSSGQTSVFTFLGGPSGEMYCVGQARNLA